MRGSNSGISRQMELTTSQWRLYILFAKHYWQDSATGFGSFCYFTL